jgi:uridine kinase
VVSAARDAVLGVVAAHIGGLGERPIVAIDGVDGAGKTRFADELGEWIERAGRPALRASIDGFHNPRSERLRRGTASPEGYFLDSYNYDDFIGRLVMPFRGGAKSVDTAIFDYRADRAMTSARPVLENAVLLIDGIFLHRDELAPLWQASVLLQVPFATAFSRMGLRDGTSNDWESMENRRYLEGQRLYLRTCVPQHKATFVVDNEAIEAPAIIGSAASAIRAETKTAPEGAVSNKPDQMS